MALNNPDSRGVLSDEQSSGTVGGYEGTWHNVTEGWKVIFGDRGIRVYWPQTKYWKPNNKPTYLWVEPGPTTPKELPPMPELDTTSSAWGQTIPVGFGIRKVKGAAIWLSKPRRDELATKPVDPYANIPVIFTTKRWEDTGEIEGYALEYQNRDYVLQSARAQKEEIRLAGGQRAYIAAGNRVWRWIKYNRVNKDWSYGAIVSDGSTIDVFG